MTIKRTHQTYAIILAGCMLLGACSGASDTPAPPVAEPTYATAKAADEAIPDALRPEYQHMLECEMKAMAAKGQEPEIDKATVVRLTREVKAGRRAPPGC